MDMAFESPALALQQNRGVEGLGILLVQVFEHNASRMDMVFESQALALQQKRGRDRVFFLVQPLIKTQVELPV
jgi:hypothetical protein